MLKPIFILIVTLTTLVSANDSGKELFKKCVACHGTHGEKKSFK